MALRVDRWSVGLGPIRQSRQALYRSTLHECHRRTAGKVGGEVGPQRFELGALRITADRRHVRCQDDIVASDQALWHVRLDFEHVERRAGYEALLECVPRRPRFRLTW